jgi:hypothetical protein
MSLVKHLVTYELALYIPIVAIIVLVVSVFIIVSSQTPAHLPIRLRN